MRIFKTACLVALQHRVYVLVYLVVLSLFAVGVSASVGDASHEEFHAEKPSVAVIDRDGSALSRALASYVVRHGQQVTLEDDDFALQTAAARDMASYVLVVPAGFGDALATAARAGAPAPDLETMTSFNSANAALIDVQAKRFASLCYALAAGAADASLDEVARLALDSAAHEARVEYVAADAGTSTRLLTYLLFSTYPAFAATAICIAAGLAPLRRPEMRRRLAATPVPALSQGAQTAGVCVLFGVASWAWLALVGCVVYAPDVAALAPSAAGVFAAGLFAVALVGVAFGFLLWQLGVSEEVANACGNIVGLLLSFAGGVWVPLSLLGDTLVSLAQFTPVYWTARAFELVAGQGASDAEVVAEALSCVGMTALFALAVFAVGLALAQVRRRTRA